MDKYDVYQVGLRIYNSRHGGDNLMKHLSNHCKEMGVIFSRTMTIDEIHKVLLKFPPRRDTMKRWWDFRREQRHEKCLTLEGI